MARIARSARVVPATPPRLTALDALRGFDLFWIIGADGLVHALGKTLNHPWLQAVTEQLEHVDWAGCHFEDLIFPLFVFIAGVSQIWSLDRARREGGTARAASRLLRRTCLLYFLGVFYYGGLSEGLAHVRWLGVLQRIALASGAAGLLALMLDTRGLAAATVAILAGYWALLTLVPFPGGVPGDFAEGHNLANWLDKMYLPGHRYDGDHDPEGLLSTLPAVATCLLGVLTGLWLRRGPAAPVRRGLMLLAAGALLTAAGWAWHPWFPVIKKLWTSSYVLVAGGWSLGLLGLFLLVIDGAGLSRWAGPFVWIGANPLLLYVGSSLVSPDDVARRLVGGEIAGAFHDWGDLVITGTGFLLLVFLARFLYRRQIFIRA